jgi:aspartate aminotransferase
LNYSENTTKRFTQKWCIQLGTRSPFKSHSRRILAGLGKQLATMLQRANLEVLSPEAGFYLFPDFEPYRPQLQAKGISNSVELCDRLLEDTGVAILPGVDFEQPLEELTVRMAYVNFNGSQALDQASGLKAKAEIDEHFLQQNCPTWLGSFYGIRTILPHLPSFMTS